MNKSGIFSRVQWGGGGVGGGGGGAKITHDHVHDANTYRW